MGHVVLLGDSIFDNARYVPGGPAVIDQLQQALPSGWKATLLALDGDLTPGVAIQLRHLPADATHFFVSVGGNDALVQSEILPRPVRTVAEALKILQEARQPFRRHYRAMLDAVLATQKPTTVCTIYDAIPGLGAAELAALAGFNEIILYEAARAGVPLIDLRLTCNERQDYSAVSRIEPSAHGGAKIARAIAQVATQHDFSLKRCTVYT